MNLKEEIQNHSFPIASEDVGREDMILDETAELIAEAYAKNKAWEAFKEGEKTAVGIAAKLSISENELRKTFEEWWEENK